MKFLKKLRVLFLLLLLILVSTYAVLQTEAFYTKFLIPKIGAALNLKIAVKSVQVEPRRMILIEGLEIESRDGHQHSVQSVALRYSLLPLMWGVMRIDSLRVDSLSMNLNSLMAAPGISQSNKSKAVPDNNEPKTTNSLPWYLTNLEIGAVTIENANLLDIPGILETGVQVEELNLEVSDYQSRSRFPGKFEFVFRAPTDNALVPEHARVKLDSHWEVLPDSQSVSSQLKLAVTELNGSIGQIDLNSKALNLISDIKLAANTLHLNNSSLTVLDHLHQIIQCTGSISFGLQDGNFDHKLQFKALNEATFTFLSGQPSPVSDLNLDLDLQGTLNKGTYKGVAQFDILREQRSIASGTIHGAHSSKNFDAKSQVSIALTDALEIFSDTTVPVNALQAHADIELSADNVALNQFSNKLNLNIKNASDTKVAELMFTGIFDASDARPVLNGSLQVPLLQANELHLRQQTANSSKQDIIEPQTQQSKTSAGLPFDLNLELDLSNWSHAVNTLHKLRADLNITPKHYELENLLVELNEATAQGSIQLSSDLSIDQSTIDLEAKNLDLGQILTSLNPKLGQDLSGRVKRFRATTQHSSNGSKGREGVHVISVGSTLESLEVPAYLQDTPPLNLLFLPVKALDATIGTLGGLILPEELVNMTNSINGSFRKLGQINFNEAQVRLRIDSHGTIIEDTNFNSSLFPTLSFNGEIGRDNALTMVIGIEILKVPVPLTVGGTLGLPLPDLTSFPYQVARSIGLGIGNVGKLFSSKPQQQALVPEEDD